VDQDGGSDLVDIVAVSQDGSETANATGVVSVTDWTPIRSDKYGHLLRVQVRPVQHCSSWNFSRLSFEIKMARRFRIRIGEVYITDWVSSNVIQYTAYRIRRVARLLQGGSLPLPYSLLFPSLAPFPPFLFHFLSSLCLPFPALLSPAIQLGVWGALCMLCYVRCGISPCKTAGHIRSSERSALERIECFNHNLSPTCMQRIPCRVLLAMNPQDFVTS